MPAKTYVGTSSIARQVKKMYIGVNGIARKCFGSSLTKNGEATSLSEARAGLAATTVGNYALFGGGSNSGSNRSTVDAYNTS